MFISTPYLPTTVGGMGGTLGIFNQPMVATQQQQQLQLQQDNRLKTQLAIKAPGVFGDERDQILVRFNMLQACCGTGKGLVSYSGQPQTVDFTTDNPVCRFKVCHTLMRENSVPSLLALMHTHTHRLSATTGFPRSGTRTAWSPCSSRSRTKSF